MQLSPNLTYETLLERIGSTFSIGRTQAAQAVQSNLLQTYWQIGQHIVSFEQGGNTRAEYGAKLLERLSKDLTLRYGKSFSRSNLYMMRLFYSKFPIFQTVSGKLSGLSWSHFCELLPIDHDLERSFYEQQSILEKWSVSELRRQKKSSLFLRLAASQDKAGILALAENGRIVERPEDLIREPYVLEFLNVPAPYQISESNLEKKLINHLQQFLLELGKGFAFIQQQYRITLGNRHHFVDLVFYHRILKCFVLIDLKREEAGYHDVGQMNMYLGYFENEENTEGDNPPIGIVLARQKDDILLKYALHGITTQLFVSKYQLYLPDEAVLRQEIGKIIDESL